MLLKYQGQMQLFGQKGPTDKPGVLEVASYPHKKGTREAALTFGGKRGFAVPVRRPTFRISRVTGEVFSSFCIS